MARGNAKRQALLKRKHEKDLLLKKEEKIKNSETISIPQIFEEWLKPCRYKIGYGGRGAGKSWNIAILLVLQSLEKQLRILCCREYQANISQSVHRLLQDIIHRFGLSAYFNITKTEITCTLTGSQFLFKGLHHNPYEIKSLEGVDICWVEEGQSVSKQSWDILIPTIRKNNSEIWVSFNPDLETDETYQRFVINKGDNVLLQKINFDANPYFPDVLREEMEHCKRTDKEAYNNIWLGECRKYSDAQIFKDKFEIVDFETPQNIKFLFGADWGFAKDPSTLIRCFIVENTLYIDKELYAVGVDLDQLPNFYRAMPHIEKSRIMADNSRPETIHFMKKKGFWIEGAKKWGGSVQDGISIMKGFDKIIIHSSCKHTADEFRFYSYKVDRLSNEVLPVIEDKHNHCIDAIRYALDGHIRNKKPMKFR